MLTGRALRSSMIKTVTKRSGFTVDYDRSKIRNAIAGANKDSVQQMSEKDIDAVTEQVERAIEDRDTIGVEEIQDVVEQELMRFDFYEVAKKYITYRQKHTERRKAQKHLMESYRDIFFADAVDSDLKRDNANINTDASMGIMLKLGAEGAKHFVDNYVLDEEFRAADKENWIHIHDKDFSLITFNCLVPESRIVFKNGAGKIMRVTMDYFDPWFEKSHSDCVDVSHCGFSILSKGGKFTPIKKLMRRNNTEDIYHIVTKSGRFIDATSDHILEVTREDDSVKELTVKELVEGDEIPVPEFPELYGEPLKEINLIDLFLEHKTEGIVIANSDFVRKSVPEDHKTYFYETIRNNNHHDSKTSMYQRNFFIQEYAAVRDLLKLDESKLELTYYGGRHSIPAVLPVNKALGKFIGYILSEGYIDETGRCIQFANQEKKLLEEFKACAATLFPKINITETEMGKGNSTASSDVIRAFGRILVEAFHGILAYKEHSNFIDLPDWYFQANNEFLSGFFASEIDGDGSINNNRVVFSSVSEPLVDKMLQILAYRNIVAQKTAVKSKDTEAAFAEGRTKRRYDTYKLALSGEALLKFVGLCKDCHKINAEYEEPHILRKSHGGKIVSIERRAYEGYVYDFETEDHFFVVNELLSHNCCQIDLLKLFKGGFSTGHGFLREPNSIRAYASLACIAIQSNQNDMFGGQSINCFDYAMAEGVKKSFKKAVLDEAYRALRYRCGLVGRETEKEFKRILKEKLDFSLCSYEESREANAEHYDAAIKELTRALDETVSAMVNLPAGELDVEVIYQLSCEDVVEETHQAMEALIHNFNTLHSRAGAQVPFSSINYGMDTTPEGRLVTREVLNAIWSGLGNGETPIFPISVFQLKAGVNYNPEDRNYDLFMKACKVSAKRLFPNFVNLDAPYNLQYYKEGDYNSYVATMGCRTRVMSNVNGPEESGSRGNFAFTTINLPKMALAAKGDMDKFWELLDHYIQVSHDYLLARLSVIEQKHVYNYPFLMGQGVWMGSENLRPEDSIKEVLKHASFSIGFCGLAECLVALTGQHHGESAKAQELGLRIVGHIREKTDEYSRAEHMNWTCFGTPAESTAGQFQRSNRKNYGVIKGVTDRPYMTNSSHVPVYYPIKAIDKIKIEAPYHALENAGHIAYIEMDGDPTKNVKAFEAVVRAMHDHDMGYFSINHPVDRDPVCGYTGIIENECPHCHRREVETGSFTIKRMKK